MENESIAVRRCTLEFYNRYGKQPTMRRDYSEQDNGDYSRNDGAKFGRKSEMRNPTACDARCECTHNQSQI